MYKSLTSVAITFLFAFQVNGQLVVDGTPSPTCLLYTSDAADERSSVDLGGRRIIKKKNRNNHEAHADV